MNVITKHFVVTWYTEPNYSTPPYRGIEQVSINVFADEYTAHELEIMAGEKARYKVHSANGLYNIRIKHVQPIGS